jgi:hypothetical protein
MYSGDDYYGDDITSGGFGVSYLDDDMRYALIDAILKITRDYARGYLLDLTDVELEELADEYDVEIQG